jgi:lipoprotein signal peptidase
MKDIKDRLRQIKFAEIFLCFCVPWWLFYLLMILFLSTSGFPDSKIMMMYNLVFPAMTLFLAGVIINLLASDKTGISFAKMAISVIILVLVDQVIKLVVIPHKDTVIPVIDAWLLIKPVYTSDHFLNRRGIYLPHWTVILAAPLIILVYRYFSFAKKDKWFTSQAVTLLIAGMLASACDKIIYGGTYDYIQLTQFLIFDLKDIYGMLGLCIIIQANVHNQSRDVLKRELLKSLSDIEYFKYEYANVKRWVLKLKTRKKGGN